MLRLRQHLFGATAMGQTCECNDGWVENEDRRPKNEDPFKIVLKSLEKGSNMIFDRSRNEEQLLVGLCTKRRPFKIVLKSLQNGSNMIIDRSRNKEQQDLRLSTNFTRVFVLYITLPKVQNEDPRKIV